MTASGWTWLAAAGVLAVLDWIAVGKAARRLERIAKPLVMLALIAVVVTATASDVRSWLLAALAFGLVGDLALAFEPRPVEMISAPRPVRTLLPAGAAPRTETIPAEAGTDRESPTFMIGLAAFLIGHVCYLGALWSYRIDRLSVVFGLLLVLMALLSFGYRIIAGAHVQGGPAMTIGVTLYMAALGSVVVLGVGTAQLWVAVGVVLFAISDLMLGYDRFVQRRTWAPVAVIVTYHVAQALIVLGLVG